IIDSVAAKINLPRAIRSRCDSSDATMAEDTLETVLRRDRIVVATALAGLAALAWAYVLWLAVDMDMGGMDMSDFRMIPAGIGIMAPALSPWSGMSAAPVARMKLHPAAQRPSIFAGPIAARRKTRATARAMVESVPKMPADGGLFQCVLRVSRVL